MAERTCGKCRHYVNRDVLRGFCNAPGPMCQGDEDRDGVAEDQDATACECFVAKERTDMTPEQIERIWNMFSFLESDTVTPAEAERNRAAINAELSHYVRVTEPAPVSERTCGQCRHFMDAVPGEYAI